MFWKKGYARSRAGLSLIELIVVITIVGMLLALLLPAVQWTREKARQTQCRNNFRQVGIALHNYATVHGRFPILGGNAAWTVSIAPDLELKPLFDRYDQVHDSATSTVNEQLGRQRVNVFSCPSTKELTIAPSGWCVGNVALNFEVLGLRPDHCKDGTSNTAAGVEVDSERMLAWITGPALFVGIEDSVHEGRFTLLFVDGSVRTVPQTIDENTIRAIGTPNGGEIVNLQ